MTSKLTDTQTTSLKENCSDETIPGMLLNAIIEIQGYTIAYSAGSGHGTLSGLQASIPSENIFATTTSLLRLLDEDPSAHFVNRKYHLQASII